MRTKSITALLFSIVVILCLCSFSETDDFFRYEIDDNSNAVIISYVGEKFSTDADIPSEIDGHTVVKICEGAFYEHKYLESVSIPNTVEIIEQAAFENCNDLKTVSFEDGEKPITIGESAFKGCSYLKELTLSNRPTKIGDFAFQGCKRLSSLTVPASVTEIGFEAFDGCEQLIMNVENSTIAKDYAANHSIPTNFFESDNFTFIIIAVTTLILLVAVYIISRKIIAAKNKKISKEN